MVKKVLILAIYILAFSLLAVVLGSNQPVSADCVPISTPNADYIVCDGNAPTTGTNAGGGNDTVIILPGGAADFIAGGADNDFIKNRRGIIDYIFGDDTGGNTGGNDTIINNGQVNNGIYGDTNVVNGGNDIITNNGFAAYIAGDWSDFGGIDIIINNREAGNICGDDANVGASDTIINNGEVGNINGDCANGGANDTIINNGYASNLYGDNAISGGNDYIENNGWVDYIAGDNAMGGGNDYIVNYGWVYEICGDDSFSSGNDMIVNYGYAYEIHGDCSDDAGGDDTVINYGFVDYIYTDDGPASFDGLDYVLNMGEVGDQGINTAGGDDLVVIAAYSYVEGIINGGEGAEVNGDTLQGMTRKAALNGATTLLLSVDCTVVVCPANTTYKGISYTLANFEFIEIWK